MKAHKDTSRKKRRRLISFHSTSCREREENKKYLRRIEKKEKKNDMKIAEHGTTLAH